MREGIVRKGLVVVIILLFVGTSILPSVNRNTIQGSSAAMECNSQISDNKQKQILDNSPSIPLFFTMNKGQFPAEVLFQTRTPEATIYLCKNKIVTVFIRELNDSKSGELNENQNSLEHMLMRETQPMERISTVAEFIGENPSTVITGEHRLPNNNNYFIGNDPLNWQTNVPNYQSVTYNNVYPGIDLKYYANKNGLKYDFIVNPGADFSQIQVHYTGISELSVTSNGALQVETRFGVISENTPLVYQKIGGVTHEIQGRYVLRSSNVFGFMIEGYDPLIPLVIDPAIVYSTFLGGTGDDHGYNIAVDANGSAYISGITDSSDFPTTPGAYDTTFNGRLDIFVTKLSPSGKTLVYSTFIGGADLDFTYNIAVDTHGSAYITGGTVSSDFPTTPGAYDTTFNNDEDGFVTKLSPSGNTLVYSTFLGGGSDKRDIEAGEGIVVDVDGFAYISGTTDSSDFPTTPGAYDTALNGITDGFVTKLSPSGNTLVYSTYLGGYSYEWFGVITVDGNGSAYITGITDSSDFPTTPGAYDTALNGHSDVFMTRLSPSGNTLIFSTFLGGTSNESRADSLALDAMGYTYIAGYTDSIDFPTTPGAFDTTYNGHGDVFVTKLSPSGKTLVYSTFLGGTDGESHGEIAVDVNESVYITGVTNSSDFPTTPDAYDTTYNGDYDVFVTKLSPSGNTLVYSTFLGKNNEDVGFDIAMDTNGYTYITGTTNSSDFPTTPDAYDTTYNGDYDVFVTKLLTEAIGKPYYFIQLSDTHIDAGSVNQGALNRLLATLNHIRNFNPPPKFIIISGDLGDTGCVANYDSFQSCFYGNDSQMYLDVALKIPAYICPGNHDQRIYGLIPYDLCFDYPDENGYHCYSKSFENTKILSVDSGCDVWWGGDWIPPWNLGNALKMPEGAGLEQATIDWLGNVLNNNKINIIFTHHPVLNDYECWDDGAFRWRKDSFLTQCVNNQVGLVLSGHTHRGDVYKWVGGQKSRITGQYDNDDEPYYYLTYSDSSYTRTLNVQTPDVASSYSYRNISVSDEGIRVYKYKYVKSTCTGTLAWSTGSKNNGSEIARLHVYDSQGNHVGINESGGIDYQINGSFYTPLIGLNETLYGVRTSVNFGEDAYIFEIEGLADGDVNFTCRYFCGNVFGDLFTKYENISLMNDSIGKLYVNNGSLDYTIYIDDDGDGIVDREIHPTNITTEPPYPPKKPEGAPIGLIGREYAFIANTTDPNKDQIYYIFSWGDGANSSWLGPFESGQEVTALHQWDRPGIYEIMVKAKDIYGDEGGWSKPSVVHVVSLKPAIILGLFTEKNQTGEFITFNAQFLVIFPSNSHVYSSGQNIVISKDYIFGFVGKRVVIGIFSTAILSESNVSIYPFCDRFKLLLTPTP
jgi:predicted MPP superfamily phosphohydrolase